MEQERTTVLANIKGHYPKMFAAEKKVARFVLNHPEEAIMMNVSGTGQGKRSKRCHCDQDAKESAILVILKCGSSSPMTWENPG